MVVNLFLLIFFLIQFHQVFSYFLFFFILFSFSFTKEKMLVSFSHPCFCIWPLEKQQVKELHTKSAVLYVSTRWHRDVTKRKKHSISNVVFFTFLLM